MIAAVRCGAVWSSSRGENKGNEDDRLALLVVRRGGEVGGVDRDNRRKLPAASSR
jgi:hypothetical protein